MRFCIKSRRIKDIKSIDGSTSRVMNDSGYIKVFWRAMFAYEAGPVSPTEQKTVTDDLLSPSRNHKE
nr:hypothetical protein [Tanacetum cinerariifolium]